MGNKLVTPIFRGSFPKLFTAEAMQEGGVKKFGISAIWDPSKFSAKEKELWAAILAELDRVSMEKFKKNVGQLPANFKRAVRDGEEKADLGGYGAGVVFANLTTKMKPGIIDRDRTPITDESEVYPGAYYRATVTAYAYDAGGGRGVALGLQNVQKVKDGDRLDSRTEATDDFADDLAADDRDEIDPLL